MINEMISDELRAQHPEVYWLDVDDAADLAAYLQRHNWLNVNEHIASVAKAGEGNMNCTLRVTTNQRSFIVKQSRPWVEKYPTIAAPWERALIEGQFYQLIAAHAELQTAMPRLLGHDAESRINVFEDLGTAEDLTSLYQPDAVTLNEKQLEQLATYLSLLHRSFLGYENKSAFANRAMRALNHFHIFVFPLQKENGFDLDALTPGLQAAAQTLQDHDAYVQRVGELGELYLSDGAALLHGDFFPGSWLQTSDGLKVIDPEFCFFGAPEFELGVTLAHLHLTGHSPALIEHWLQSYQPATEWRPELVQQFAGVEIMRRLIGVAQLPLALDLAQKTAWLQRSLALVTGRIV